MYTSKFRDKVYEDQHGTPPWTALEHKEQTVSLLSEYLPQTVEGKHILDYGCGDGKIGEHFLKMGADLDFAEISDKMVELLRKKYLYQSELLDAVGNGVDNTRKVQVYKVETPHDIPDKESYDYIISRCVFHHIDPKLWKDFIDELMAHLKKGGKLMIGGWDISDDVLKQDGQLGHVTGQHSRYINDLPQHIDSGMYEIEDTGILVEKNPTFDMSRKLRYFVIRHKEYHSAGDYGYEFNK